MDKSTQQNNADEIFYDRYSVKSDEFLLDLLRQRKDYQESAVKAAIRLAIERKLIHSEQDLLAPEYQENTTTRFTFFPIVSNSYHQKRLMGSIFRFLYVLSFVPAIYAFLKYGEGKLDQTFLGAGLAMGWLLLTFLLQKTQNTFILIPQFLLLIGVFVVISMHLVDQESLNKLDVVMLMVGILTPSYLLLYCRRIFEYLKMKESK